MEANNHRGNIQPTLDLEEHDGLLNVKRTSLVSAATIYAVVNTSSGGNVTVSMPGGVTVFQGTDPWRTSINGNLTLSDSKEYIGLVTNTQANAIPAGANYIGLTTVDIGAQNIIRLNSNVTLNSSVNNIGFASVTPVIAWPDPKAYVGLVTAFNANQPALIAGAAYVGLMTIDIGTQNTVVNGAGVAGIGFATVNVAAGIAGIGFATVGVGAGVSNIGFATVFQAVP